MNIISFSFYEDSDLTEKYITRYKSHTLILNSFLHIFFTKKIFSPMITGVIMLCYYAWSCVIMPGAMYVSLPGAMFFSLSCVVLPRAVLLYFVWSRHFEAAPVSTF